MGSIAVGILSFWFSRWLTQTKRGLSTPTLQNLVRYGLGLVPAAGVTAAAFLSGQPMVWTVCLFPALFIYWILGARLSEKPYSLIFRQQHLIFRPYCTFWCY